MFLFQPPLLQQEECNTLGRNISHLVFQVRTKIRHILPDGLVCLFLMERVTQAREKEEEEEGKIIYSHFQAFLVL